jgi:hypothetical protein
VRWHAGPKGRTRVALTFRPAPGLDSREPPITTRRLTPPIRGVLNRENKKPIGGGIRDHDTRVLKKFSRACRDHTPVSGARMLLLLAIGFVGAIASSSAACGTVLTVTGPFLYYSNKGPSALFGAGSERILVGANSVMPNGSGLGGFPASTGFATTTNLNTGSTITQTIGFDPSPITPNFFVGSVPICTMACAPSGNNNPINLTGPWTITFQNPGPAPTSVSNILSPAGPGEIPFVNSITLSGTSAQPTFSWSPPAGMIAPDGYRIQIYQNNLTLPMDNQAGEVVHHLTANDDFLHCTAFRLYGPGTSAPA